MSVKTNSGPVPPGPGGEPHEHTADRKALHRVGSWARRGPMLPALVFLIIVTQVPMAITVVISFFHWNALYPNDIEFSWFDNYVEIFSTQDLRKSVVTTILLTVVVVLVSLVLGMIIALLLDRKFPGRGVVRTLMISPFLIVPIASALVWKHAILNPDHGLINGVLTWVWRLFGADPPQPDWLSHWPLSSIEAALIWQWTPFMMLILLAGLQSRPLDVIEAARVDGASTWQVFQHMTLPHMRRYIELAALLGCIYIVQVFDAVYTITSGGLGTANLPYTIFEQVFEEHDYGTASASGVLVVIGSIAVAMFALRSVSSLLKEETR